MAHEAAKVATTNVEQMRPSTHPCSTTATNPFKSSTSLHFPKRHEMGFPQGFQRPPIPSVSYDRQAPRNDKHSEEHENDRHGEQIPLREHLWQLWCVSDGVHHVQLWPIGSQLSGEIGQMCWTAMCNQITIH
jgi:hypothetical protein